MNFSIIIPVYNRPVELDELLQSIVKQKFKDAFEVVIIDDGSTNKSDKIAYDFKNFLNINYFFKENSGPGDSRNYGMKKAKGDYFIILDSDCILPSNYLNVVKNTLKQDFTDAYGGADTSHNSFNKQQKAINFSMTSILTTGGIRGSEVTRNKFQLRSFNMGISKESFLKTGGFSKQNFGEDIDLTFKLWQHNFTTKYVPRAFVYHKRRTSWSQFYHQTFNFGAARPVLNKIHPNSAKITYWFPSVFVLGFLGVLLGWMLNTPFILMLYVLYFLAIFTHALYINKNIWVAALSIFATAVQFFGYGLGFLRSMFRLHILKKDVKMAFPKMFN